jgi:hypothetical protein
MHVLKRKYMRCSFIIQKKGSSHIQQGKGKNHRYTLSLKNLTAMIECAHHLQTRTTNAILNGRDKRWKLPLYQRYCPIKTTKRTRWLRARKYHVCTRAVFHPQWYRSSTKSFKKIYITWTTSIYRSIKILI